MSVSLVYYSLNLTLDVMYALLASKGVERNLLGASGKPNMLLFVLDQWRYDWDGLTEDTPTGKNPLAMPYLKDAAAKGVLTTSIFRVTLTLLCL